MPAMDDEIARHLREAAASGELEKIEGYGKPLPEDAGWSATPEALRMPFKVLKNAGCVPPEVELFQQRAALAAELARCSDANTQLTLRTRLSELEQKLAVRLESLRAHQSL